MTVSAIRFCLGKTTRPAAFDGISEFQTNRTLLHSEIAELRVIKTERELEVLKYANKVVHRFFLIFVIPVPELSNHRYRKMKN
jgi:hypothetical protein